MYTFNWIHWVDVLRYFIIQNEALNAFRKAVNLFSLSLILNISVISIRNFIDALSGPNPTTAFLEDALYHQGSPCDSWWTLSAPR